MRNVNEEWGKMDIEGMEVWKAKEAGSKKRGEEEGKHQVLLKKRYKMQNERDQIIARERASAGLTGLSAKLNGLQYLSHISF